MRKIKEVLRLKWAHKLSNRKIAKSCFISRSTVADYLLRAKLAGLSWPLDPEMDDAAIENLLFPVTDKSVPAERRIPDMEYLYRELKRKSVTMQLLWYEYKQANPDAAYDEPCDTFVPCAVGGVLNKENIPSLKCQAVAGAANNQLGNPEDAIRLRDRAILYAPDFIANSGGAIAVIGMEMSGWSKGGAKRRVIQTIRENLSNIFELSETDGCSMHEAAYRIADMRLTAQSPA